MTSVAVAKAVAVAASLALVLVPASVHRRRVAREVVESRKGPRERALLALVSLAFLLPLVWVASPLLRFADRAPSPVALGAGSALIVAGLVLLHRSHAALGPHWSISLELHADHRLVVHGPHRHVRHPMYGALLLYGAGLALAVPNWVAGPAYLGAVAILVALRIGPEERMLRDRFGAEYEAYRRRTARLVPGIW